MVLPGRTCRCPGWESGSALHGSIAGFDVCDDGYATMVESDDV